MQQLLERELDSGEAQKCSGNIRLSGDLSAFATKNVVIQQLLCIMMPINFCPVISNMPFRLANKARRRQAQYA